MLKLTIMKQVEITGSLHWGAFFFFFPNTNFPERSYFRPSGQVHIIHCPREKKYSKSPKNKLK